MKHFAAFLAAFSILAIIFNTSYNGGVSARSFKGHPCPKNYMFSCQPKLIPTPCHHRAADFEYHDNTYVRELPSAINVPHVSKGLNQQLDEYSNYYDYND